MNLYQDIWLEQGYYVDFDTLGQFRIIGPNNHLYCGLIDIPRHHLTVRSVKAETDGSLRVKGFFTPEQLRLYEPVMGDIRSIRQFQKTSPQFLALRHEHPGEIAPHFTHLQHGKKNTALTFRRTYGNHLYQVVFVFPKQIDIQQITTPLKGYELKTSGKRIPFEIIADTDDIHPTTIGDLFTTHPTDFTWSVFGRLAPLVKRELRLTELEIEHMLTWNKTSGDRFGTVFPRDWMEAADIGMHDLSSTARMHMYAQALKQVNVKGEGWHEDVIGERRYQYLQQHKELVDRHMIDIEPHYLMGLDRLPDDFLMDTYTLQSVQRVARFVITKARQRKLITFKKKNKKEFFLTGNWRDSSWAYKQLSPIIAPFDVNAVFYPRALQVLHEKEHLLNLRVPDLHNILEDWLEIKQRYCFTNPDGRSAFALALLGKNEKQLAVNHLDESYYLTYLEATEKEVESFVDRLMDPAYFYTPSGPVLVAKNNQYGYTPDEYHGEVIWTKQVAYAVLGLSKHLKTAIIQDWPLPLKRKMRSAITKTCENMIRVYAKLGYIPEVHADEGGKPILPTDPQGVSRVQLWSAVGARRIFRKYYDMKTDLRYKFHD